jgi:exosortase
MPLMQQLAPQVRLAAFALLGLTAFVIYDQYTWWQLRDEYAFGFIVPLFVAYVLYDRWPRIAAVLAGPAPVAAVDPAPRWLRTALTLVAAAMVTGGLAAFLLGAAYRATEGANLITSHFLAFGFVNIVLGAVFLYSGHNAAGAPVPLAARVRVTLLFLFPALIWMLSVPLFDAVHKTVSTFLMNKVAVVVFNGFDMLGYAVIREGSVLRLPQGDVGVEDACSGIRSLTACLFAGSFLGAVYFESFWKKVFMVGTAMLFAFLNNILRSLFLTGWAYAYGPGALDGDVVWLGMNFGNIHDLTGWLVLGLTVACLLLTVQLFSIRLEFKPQPAAPAT